MHTTKARCARDLGRKKTTVRSHLIVPACALSPPSGRLKVRSEYTPPGSSARSASFTLIELLVVIGIIALLAGLVVGLTAYTGTKIRENRIRAELNQLATAIEAYHAKFNQYPPDNVVARNPYVVNPVTNSLYYELTGAIVDDRNPRFRSPNRQQWIPPAMLQQFFRADGFINAGTSPKEIKQFLPSLKSEQSKAISKGAPEPDIEVLVVPVPWPLNRNDQPVSYKPGLNPWRYVSTQPTNNPATFDLWAEYVERGKVRIICNWSKDVLDK